MNDESLSSTAAFVAHLPDCTLKEQIMQSTPQMALSSKLAIVPPPHANTVWTAPRLLRMLLLGRPLPTEPLFIVKRLRSEAQAGDSVSDGDTASGFDQTMPRPARSWSCSWNQGSTEPKFEAHGWVPCGDKNGGSPRLPGYLPQGSPVRTLESEQPAFEPERRTSSL